MPDSKLSALTALTAAGAAADDLALVSDMSVPESKSMRYDALLDAILRVAAAADCVLTVDATNGKLVVRQRAGTPGTDEGQLSHTGSLLQIESKDGPIHFTIPTAGSLQLVNSGGLPTLVDTANGPATGGYVAFSNNVRLGNAGGDWVVVDFLTLRLHTAVKITWASDDTELSRAAAKVVRFGSALDGHTLSSVPLPPSQIVADTNNYAPGVARYYRLTTDASRTLTGLVAGVDGEEREIWNVGSFNLVLAHQSGSSTAANRFVCQNSLDLTILPGEMAYLRYDGTTARWRVFPEAVISRVAAGVLGMGTGTWLQQAGRSRVDTAAPVTNATDTMAAITGLSATLIAGRKYAGTMTLYVSTDVAAEGIKFDFDGGAATMTAFNAAVTGNVQAATAGVTVSAALATDITFTALTGTGVNCIVISFDLVCNAAGTFIPRFSQVAHALGTATVVAANLSLDDYP